MNHEFVLTVLIGLQQMLLSKCCKKILQLKIVKLYSTYIMKIVKYPLNLSLHKVLLWLSLNKTSQSKHKSLENFRSLMYHEVERGDQLMMAWPLSVQDSCGEHVIA